MSQQSARFVVRFKGDVQGVGFRATATQEARGLDVHGFVRNEPDGTVTVDADGPPDDLNTLVSRIRSSMGAKISGVDLDRREPQGRNDGFGIQY